jgi:hypothetical protein
MCPDRPPARGGPAIVDRLGARQRRDRLHQRSHPSASEGTCTRPTADSGHADPARAARTVRRCASSRQRAGGSGGQHPQAPARPDLPISAGAPCPSAAGVSPCPSSPGEGWRDAAASVCRRVLAGAKESAAADAGPPMRMEHAIEGRSGRRHWNEDGRSPTTRLGQLPVRCATIAHRDLQDRAPRRCQVPLAVLGRFRGRLPPPRAHKTPTEGPKTPTRNHERSTLNPLVRAAFTRPSAGQKSVSSELLIRGLWVRSPRGPPR